MYHCRIDILWVPSLVSFSLILMTMFMEIVKGDMVPGIFHFPIRRCQVLLPQEQTTRRIERDAGNLEYEVAPLGVGYGTFFAELSIGHPPQTESVIVDTGSHLTAFPCVGCDSCGDHTDPAFDITMSNTAKKLTCSTYDHCQSCQVDKCIVSQSYSEGSTWTAMMVEDSCALGGIMGSNNSMFSKDPYSIRFPFGCQIRETGLFVSQKANGIMGLSNNQNTIFAHLVQQGLLSKPLFALCLGPNGGSMTFGGINTSCHREPVQYAQIRNTNTDWYTVKLLDIRMNNVSIGIPTDSLNTGHGVIVDSGTTDTFFPRVFGQPFRRAFEQHTGYVYVDGSAKGAEMSLEAMDKYPKIEIVLQSAFTGEADVVLSIPPSQYLTVGQNGRVFGNFHFTEHAGAVLGTTTMFNYDVIFNAAENWIGFARSSCGYDGETTSWNMMPDSRDNFTSILSTVLLTRTVVTAAFVAVGFVAYTIRLRLRLRHQWTRLSTTYATRESDREQLNNTIGAAPIP